ncbi:MAG: HAD hydrolase-like protein, partial [Candidatus Saccharimonadales bacterium]
VDFIAKYSHHKPLNSADLSELNGLTLLSIARHLGCPSYRLPGLYLKGRQRMEKVVASLKPYRGIDNALDKLHAQGNELFIVSNNSVKNIRNFLTRHGMLEYFVEVYGGIELFGKSPVLQDLLGEHSLDKEQTLCVGDQVQDVKAAQSVGLKCVAVTWGFGKKSDLESAKPTRLAESPEDLITILEEL